MANGFSVSLPEAQAATARDLPGVSDVLPVGNYAPQVASTAEQIGAPALWGETLDTAGQGVKIGIIDYGVDPSHPFFDPRDTRCRRVSQRASCGSRPQR